MTARGIGWMGVQTDRFDQMRDFLRALVGTEPSTDEPGFSLWSLPSGDLVELFAQGTKPTFGAGPVVGYLVDDMDASRRAIEAAGGTVVGGSGPNEDGYVALHIRAPDGNVYEIIHDPQHAARAGGA